MDPAPHLVFGLRDSLYAVDATFVREVFSLPELTPLAEAPPFVLGVINLRGKIVPVMDLNVRLGYPPRRRRLTESVVVLEYDGQMTGIVVNDVYDVRDIPLDQSEAPPVYPRESDTRLRFVERVAGLDEHIVMILHLQNLMRMPAGIDTEVEGAAPNSHVLENETDARADPEEAAVFRERARGLMQAPERQDFTGFVPMAVVGLSGEYFGVHLRSVREFSEISQVTPVPCCPGHIAGAVNLRGEILTLVDIRKALQMPIGAPRKGLSIMVVETDDIRAGVVVDEVVDVIYLHPEDVAAVPSAVKATAVEYLEGTAPYGGKMLGIIDLARVFQNGELAVNEEI